MLFWWELRSLLWRVERRDFRSILEDLREGSSSFVWVELALLRWEGEPALKAYW
jgi:hypothetical protein